MKIEFKHGLSKSIIKDSSLYGCEILPVPNVGDYVSVRRNDRDEASTGVWILTGKVSSRNYLYNDSEAIVLITIV